MPSSLPEARVAHLITDLDVGGAERMLVKLLGALDEREHHQVICMSGRGPLFAELQALGITVLGLDMPRGRPSVMPLARAVFALRRFAPHVLQTWLYHADLLGLVLRPVVGHPALIWNLRCADMDLARYRPMTGRIRGVLAHCSALPSMVIANSEAGRIAHQGFGYHPRRWRVIGNGFDLDRYHPDVTAAAALRRRLGLASTARLIGMIARRDPAKDHTTLLAAARLVTARRADAVFYLVGAGVETLADEVRALGLGEKMVLEETRTDIPAICAGLDVLVLSSAFGEGFPNVLGEAMACAVPCVSTDVGDARALLGDSGLVVPRRDPERLAEALLAVLAWSPAERAARGNAARAHITRHHALPQVARQYAELYREFAG